MDTPLTQKKCVPCEGNVKPFTPQQAQKMLSELTPHSREASDGHNDWMLVDEAHVLVKQYTFKNFAETMAFVNKIAAIAEEEGHHPDLSISYKDVTVELMTHAIGGLSENDFIVAAKISELKK